MAWLSGGHVTPEQAALHAQYEALGMHDHHAHDHAPAGDADVINDLSTVATPPTTPMLTAASPAVRVDSAVTAQSKPGAGGMLVPPASFGTRLLLVVLAPALVAGARLDPPPRAVA